MKNVILLIILMTYSSLPSAHEDSFKLIINGKEIRITTSDLEKMPLSEIKTSTNFTPLSIFTGVKFRELVKKYNIVAGQIRAFAWDDYSYTMPVAELLEYDVILAYKKDGNYIDLSELGPYAVIYPRDSHSELETLDVNAKTVWQVKTLETVK